jgi:hypothetical protein
MYDPIAPPASANALASLNENFARGENVNGPPANRSVQAQGEWTADGMHIHFETTIEAPGSGQVDLKTGNVTGDATVTCGSHRTNPSRYRLPRQEAQAFPPTSNRQTRFTKEL